MDDIWLFDCLGWASGVVKATSEEEARAKVLEACKNHSKDYDEQNPIIIIPKREGENWFSDSPDVMGFF